MASKVKAPIKAPNPFGEAGRSGGTQPPAVSAPASTAFTPLTHITVSGQPRETHRDGHGFVLTERGWTKETENNG